MDAANLEHIRGQLARGERARALAALRTLAAQAPDQGEVYRLRAQVWLDQGRYRAAAEDLVKANHLLLGGVPLGDCTRLVLRDLGKSLDPDAVEGHVEEAPDFCGLLALGNARRAHGRHDAAREAYGRACELRPRNRAARTRLGCLLASMGQLEEADAVFAGLAERAGGPESVVRLSGALLDEMLAAGTSTIEAEAVPARVPGAAAGPAEAAAGDPEVTALVSCDSVYFQRFAPIVTRSFARNAGLRARLHFHVINPDPASLDLYRALAAEHPGMPVELTAEHRELPHRNQARTYYACARFLLAGDLLERTARAVLVMDADMVVLGSLRALAERVGDSDLGVFELDPDRHDLWDTYQASALWIAPSAQGLAFARRVAAYIGHYLRAGRLQWYLDQVAVYAAIAHGLRAPGPGAPGAPLRMARFDPGLIKLSDHDAPVDGDGAVLWSLLMSLPNSERLLDSDLVREFR